MIPLGLRFEFYDAPLFCATPTFRFIFFLLEFGLIEFYFRLFDYYLLIDRDFLFVYALNKYCTDLVMNILKRNLWYRLSTKLYF